MSPRNKQNNSKYFDGGKIPRKEKHIIYKNDLKEGKGNYVSPKDAYEMQLLQKEIYNLMDNMDRVNNNDTKSGYIRAKKITNAYNNLARKYTDDALNSGPKRIGVYTDYSKEYIKRLSSAEVDAFKDVNGFPKELGNKISPILYGHPQRSIAQGRPRIYEVPVNKTPTAKEFAIQKLGKGMQGPMLEEGGGIDTLGAISQLGYATGEPLGMGIGFGAQALDFILGMTKNPSDYTPQKMNTNGAYAQGGYMDSPIGNHAFEVGGNPGVDTNARNVKGQDVLLTKGEIVRNEPQGAYVFSNSTRKMPHPLTGKTFSETVKPIEKGIAKARKAVNKDYTDYISKNTLGHLEQLIEQNKNREEEIRQQTNSGPTMEYAVGGDIKGLITALDEMRNIRGMSDIHPLAHQLAVKNRVKDYVN
jgi:hypothetical protein